MFIKNIFRCVIVFANFMRIFSNNYSFLKFGISWYFRTSPSPTLKLSLKLSILIDIAVLRLILLMPLNFLFKFEPFPSLKRRT